MREQPAGTADAALDLVQEHQQPELVADLTDGAQIVEAHRLDAALALHGLEQEGHGLGGDRPLPRVQVPQTHLTQHPAHRVKAPSDLLHTPTTHKALSWKKGD